MKCLTNPNAAPDVKKPGVMIPIPQYPLYSASLAGKIKLRSVKINCFSDKPSYR